MADFCAVFAIFQRRRGDDHSHRPSFYAQAPTWIECMTAARVYQAQGPRCWTSGQHTRAHAIPAPTLIVTTTTTTSTALKMELHLLPFYTANILLLASFPVVLLAIRYAGSAAISLETQCLILLTFLLRYMDLYKDWQSHDLYRVAFKTTYISLATINVVTLAVAKCVHADLRLVR